MHDRARIVGRAGVAALLGDLLAVTSAPVHLVGHSYGGQVQLAAVTGMRSAKAVESVLLLQPAVNYLCLSARLPGGTPSAYRTVLSRVRQPLLTTYSKHDFPLTAMFHRAFRRHGDVGEVAAWPVPPGPYAALGGFGPGELGEECEWDKLPVPAWTQASATGGRVRALDGSTHISGHGDVTNAACCGLLRSQLLSASEAPSAPEGP
jgi:pimeloyl-ACP methyl ester carboxylesterase